MSSSTALMMFPGQGSQYPGMGKDWCAQFAQARHAFEEASDATHLDLKKICFEGSEEDLKKTEITQPAILTATLAVFRALCAHTALSEKLATAVFAGHSLGEYSALVAMEALPLGEAARLVHLRGRYMQEAVPQGKGGMAALIFRPKTTGNWEKSQELCGQVAREKNLLVSPANYNSPEQVVIAGHREAVEAVVALAPQAPWEARRALPLPVSAPFHCALMQPAADRLEKDLADARWTKPLQGARYLANVDAAFHTPEGAPAVQTRLVRQITGAVLWVQTLEAALQKGVTQAWEIGPGQVLTGLARRTSWQEQTLEARSVDRWEDFRNDRIVF